MERAKLHVVRNEFAHVAAHLVQAVAVPPAGFRPTGMGAGHHFAVSVRSLVPVN
ncbi:MAG: hypothetical protein ACI855_003622, partial [Myxococcota bacterium]